MKKQGYFDGNYYKFISPSGFSFAFIIAFSNEGKSLQLITKDKSFQIENPESIKVSDEKVFEFDVNQKDLVLKGCLEIDMLRPLKKPVMGPFEHIPFMECKHKIISMYHNVSENLFINGEAISFDGGIGYIEGDKGRNFPKHYIWYNSVLPNEETLTLAIAHIPFGLFSFTGVLCFIKMKDKEIYMSTYNGVKIIKAKDNEVILKKGKYKLSLKVDEKAGHGLSAPVKGNMVRTIKENLVVKSTYSLSEGEETIISNTDPYSSCEWVLDNK